MHAGQGDKAAAVMRPALEDGECIQVEAVAQNDFLAARLFGAHSFWKHAGQRPELRQHLQLVEKAALGRLDVDQAGDALGDLLDALHAERHGHAPLAAELVDEDLVAGMTFHVLEQQRRTAGSEVVRTSGGGSLPARSALRHPIGDLGDLQFRRDFLADPPQFAILLQGPDPVAQIVVSQCRMLSRQCVDSPSIVER